MNGLRIVLTAVLACACSAQASGQQAVIEQRLMAEPLWTVHPADGAAQAVWFTQDAGGLRMVRCAGAHPSCSSVVVATLTGFRSGSGSTWTERGAAVFSSTEGHQLYPAWMVPAPGSRTGH